MAAEVFEQIVVRVHAVERGVRRMRLVEVPEQIVDEMRKRFGNGHGSISVRVRRSGVPASTIRQWYNKCRFYMPGTLFVVATPIGNLEDITARALRVLREVALIAAEDTRRTAHLLARYAITTPTTSLHEHNEAQKSAVARRAPAARRQRRARVGRRHPDGFGSRAALIRAAIDAGIRVEPIPGPSAALAALAASGCRPTRFSFLGFPRLGQKTERRGSTRSKRWSDGRLLRGAPSDPDDACRAISEPSATVQVVGRPGADQSPRRIGQRTNFRGS